MLQAIGGLHSTTVDLIFCPYFRWNIKTLLALIKHKGVGYVTPLHLVERLCKHDMILTIALLQPS